MTKMQITQPGSRHPQCILAMSPVRPRSHFPRAIRGCPALGNSTNVQKVGPSAASRVQPHRGQHSGRTTPPSSPPADKQYLQTLVQDAAYTSAWDLQASQARDGASLHAVPHDRHCRPQL